MIKWERKLQQTKSESKHLENKIPDASTSIQTNQYNSDKQNSKKINGDAENKIPDVSGLLTTNVLNTKLIYLTLAV